MGARQVRRYCMLNTAGKQLMKMALERLGLSARAYDRILKVARTIADLDIALSTAVGGGGECRDESVMWGYVWANLMRK